MSDDDDPQEPARAFDQLRREVSLCTRAVQGLTAERQDLPDYSQTLRAIDARLQATVDGIARLAQTPALRLTPTTMTAEVERAAVAARAEDRNLLETAHRGNSDLARELRAGIQQVREAQEQRQWVLWSAVAGFGGGIMFMIAGWWAVG
ncbi:MAG TPA: hypothetical protein VMG08_11500 [Allosphingosinicella sp.]|nr:hypothetical protein [Allosphingosinicella sp.]